MITSSHFLGMYNQDSICVSFSTFSLQIYYFSTKIMEHILIFFLYGRVSLQHSCKHL